MGEIANPGLTGLEESAGDRAPKLEPRVVRGSLRDIAALVPEFARRPLAAGIDAETGEHRHLEVVVRRNDERGEPAGMPLGVVSRRYGMLPHARVIEALERALRLADIDPRQCVGEAALTAFGADMHLTIDAPRGFDPGDGTPLGLRFLCHNAVNGGGVHLLAVWHRRASDSALPVGTTSLEYRPAHLLPVRLADIAPAIKNALPAADTDHRTLAMWRQQLITRDRMVAWADGSIRRMWGVRAAARVFHIAMSGWDAESAFGFERSLPTRRTMRAIRRVPAAPEFVETVYDALLAVAWVARDARDRQRHLGRLGEIAMLMRALLRRGASR